MFDQGFLQQAILAIPAILFALTFHEFSHAYLALRFGDSTARDMGRLTLNPLAHLDFFGTLMIFLSGFRFGWAKPVPVNPFNLREPRKADFWISAAGPLSNLILAFVFGMIFRIVTGMSSSFPEGLYMFLFLSVQINVGLAIFNLIPLFPLDGSHILRSLLPEEMGPKLDQFDRISPIVLILILLTGVVGLILGPVMQILIPLFIGHP